VKFLLDENLSPLHARTFRALGHDAVSVMELGFSGVDDSVVRDAAIKQERILVTLDADFANLLRFPTAGTPGVVRFRIHPAIEEAIDAAIRFAIPRLAEMNLAGKLVVVDERKIRIRG
jgi:predicted nuclease of predicted toxin-antitoxin system